MSEKEHNGSDNEEPKEETKEKEEAKETDTTEREEIGKANSSLPLMFGKRKR